MKQLTFTPPTKHGTSKQSCQDEIRLRGDSGQDYRSCSISYLNMESLQGPGFRREDRE